MIAHLAGFIEERPSNLRHDTDLSGFFTLMMSVARSQSLLVSIPVAHCWVKLLTSDTIGSSDTVSELIGPLLEFGSQRVLRYESLPDDSDEPAILFLSEDIDTMPERHAFLGNYRRYATNIVELIVQRRPLDAFGYVLQQTDATLQDIHANQGVLDLQNYRKSSPTVIRIDAAFTAVEAALKGYSKWVAAHGKNPQQDEEQRNAIENHLLEWCVSLLNKNFEDPMIKQRVIKLAADFSSRLLENKQSFALSVLEHILTTQPPDRPEFPVYSEAVKELHQVAAHEIRRLAMRCPDYFIDFYDQLQTKIQEVLTTSTMEDRPQSDLSAVLFIIVHRATKIDAQARQTRLQSFLNPVVESWQSPALTQSLSSFKGFCELLGVDGVQNYMQSRRANKLEDWSSVQLDDEGKNMQTRMNDLFQVMPLRPSYWRMLTSSSNYH
jgi:exportin-5